MKPALKFLARLYPPSWRKRYGTEFEVLLEDATPSVRDVFDLLCGALKMQITTWSFGKITRDSTSLRLSVGNQWGRDFLYLMKKLAYC